MIVKQGELAKVLGISTRRVQQLQHDGVLHRDAIESGYKLEDCVPAYIDYKVSSETGRKSAITKEQMQAEHEKVKMDISKLKLKHLRRESFDARAIEASWSTFLTYIVGKLKTLGSKIIMDVAGEEINKQIEIADKIIDDLIQELYQYDPKDVETIDDIYEDDDDEDEDDEE